MIISFGIFQNYYVSALHQARSEIAWVGSIAVFLLFFMGIVSGRLTDAGYLRVTTIAGAVLVVLGTFMTSLAENYWQVILAQGVCTGLGNGLLLTPMMTLITTYFRRRLALVMGLAACGSVTGGLIYPSMARTLLPTIGFGWTLRAMGFIQLGTFAIALLCGKPKQSSRKPAPLLDWAVLKEPVFTLYLIGSLLVSFIAAPSLGSLFDELTYTVIGLSRRLLPVLLPQLLCSREAGNVLHPVTQSDAGSERHRVCWPLAAQPIGQAPWHDECVHSIRVRLRTMHVHLDTSTLHTRVVHLDDFL